MDNKARYDKALKWLTDYTERTPGRTKLIPVDKFRDGIIYVFVPPIIRYSPADMHDIYSAAAECDDVSYIGGEAPRYVFIVNDAFPGKPDMPKGDNANA